MIVASLAVVFVIVFVIWTSRYEDTDNAYTAAHVATLSAKVSGIVTEVTLEENTKVKKDQILVRSYGRQNLVKVQELLDQTQNRLLHHCNRQICW